MMIWYFSAASIALFLVALEKQACQRLEGSRSLPGGGSLVVRDAVNMIDFRWCYWNIAYRSLWILLPQKMRRKPCMCACVHPKSVLDSKHATRVLGIVGILPVLFIFVLWFLIFFRHRIAVLSPCVLSFLSSGLYHCNFLPRKNMSASKTGIVEEFGLPFAFWWSSILSSFIFMLPMEQILG